MRQNSHFANNNYNKKKQKKKLATTGPLDSVLDAPTVYDDEREREREKKLAYSKPLLILIRCRNERTRSSLLLHLFECRVMTVTKR